jgi:hypothetical protein
MKLYTVTCTSPSKFLTGTIFLHAHLQAVYYSCVKFHLNPLSRLGGVVLTSPSLHTERISEYKLYTDETVLVLNNPTLLKTLWRPLDVCSWLVYFGDGMLSP